MDGSKTTLVVKDMTIIAVLTAILFVQEELLTFIPNVQLTVFLIVLYSKKLGFFRTSIIVTLHVLLDNLFMGSFNLTYMPFMWLGWMLIPITINTIFKRVDNFILLAIIGAVHALLYSWIYIIPGVLIMHVDFKTYILADLPFEGILALSSFLSILILYKPCSMVLDKLLKKEETEETI